MRNTQPSSLSAFPFVAAMLVSLATPALRAQAPVRPALEVRAQVVDANGAPIEGACFLFAPQTTITTRQALTTPTAKTDVKGLLAHTIPSGPDDKPHYAMITAKGKTSVKVRLTGPERGKGEARRRIVDLGLVVLRKGVTVRGLVRSKKGRPIAGARIRAIDIFRARHLGLHIAEDCYSWAKTDAAGKFKLEGVPDRGASIQITAKGFHDFHGQYANQFAPVVVQLQAAGTVSGSVVDAAGKPAAGISVRAKFEQSDVSHSFKTDARGRFAGPLRFPGRYRLAAYFKDPSGSRQEWSAVMSGSRTDVRIQLPADRIVAENTGIRVRVTARSDGKSIQGFRAAVVWVRPQIWKHNKEYLNQRFNQTARSSNAQNELVLPGPQGSQPLAGRVLVKAKGYAHAFKDVMADGEKRVDVDLQLEPESVVEGVVVDAKTQKPIEGAGVRVMPNVHGQEKTTTDVNGRFRIGGLSKGMHSIVVANGDRPDTSPRGFRLDTGQLRKDFEIKMPRGASWGGRLYGAKIGSGWRVKLERKVEQQQVIMLPTSLAYGGPGSKGAVLVRADGKFLFTGVTKGKYQLTLHIPYSQGMLEIPVKSVSVRGSGEEKIDISALFPLPRLHGSVKTTGAALPPGRLLLVAHPRNQRIQRGGWGMMLPVAPTNQSPRALVGPGGAYDLPLRSGKYLIQLVDLATGVVLYQGKVITMKKGVKRQFDIAAALATVECKLTPVEEGQRILAHRVEIKVRHPGAASPGFPVARGVTYDLGKGLALQPGQTEFTVVLPAVTTNLIVRSAAYMLDPKQNIFSMKPIGIKTIVPKAEKITRIEIRVGAPQVNVK